MKRKLTILLTVVMVIMLFCSNVAIAAEKTVKLEFTNEDVDVDAKEIVDLTDEWSLQYGTPSCLASVQEADGNKYLALSGYISMCSYELLDAPYTYSLDVQMVENGNVGFFVRSVEPVVKFNPKNGGGVDMTFVYFEADWYKENGGATGDTGIGGSGIVIMPLSTGIRVNLKTHEADGLKVANKFYDFPIPEGLDITKFFNLKLKDDGSKVEIIINDKLLGTVEFSEKGIYEDDEEDENEYFKKAVVKDSTGAVVLDISNARINSVSSQVAIGCRNKKINIDNLSLTYNVPDPTPTPEATPTPVKTDAPKTTVAPATNAPKTDDNNSESSFSTPLILTIVGAVVVIAGVTGLLIYIGKKKQNT